MKIKSISLLAASVLCLGLASCNEKATSPDMTNDGGKTPGVLSSNCVNAFEGITSCGFGGASLQQTATGLNVTGLPESGTGGVASTFASAIDWGQDASFSLPAGGTVNYDAISNGEVVSSARVTRIGGERLAFEPRFTGSDAGTYDVAVYRQGVYVGGAARLVGGGTTTEPARPKCYMWVNTHFKDKNGKCIWGYRWVDCLVRIELQNGGSFLGDELVFTENIEDGHYPYRDFQGISVSTNALSYQITGETTIAAE